MSEIEKLRKLIVGESAEKLSRLTKRIESIDQRTKDVSEVLPPAIQNSLRKSEKLISALEVPVSESLKRAIRREPTEYADILYPVMAPAIRRAIANAISSLLSTINQNVESATSVNGLKMRLDSFKQGVPYAELALRKSLLYRVEHVFLIDRDTGLLIAELKNENVQALDSDAVSAMFSVIQSFVQDSFSQDEEDRLTDLTVGQHKVWVAHGRRAMLACVIRGDAPASLKSQIYDVLDGIRTDFSQELIDFDGNTDNFIGIEDYLSPCLQLELKATEDKHRLLSCKAILGIGVICLLAYLIYDWVNKYKKIDSIRHLLQKTPGLMVTDVRWNDDMIVVEGLKDPYAVIPIATLEAYGIDASEVDWHTKAYQSLEGEMLAARLRSVYLVPDTVLMTMQPSRLTEMPKLKLAGSVNFEWIDYHFKGLQHSVLINDVDFSELNVDQNSISEYVDLKISIPKGLVLEFKGRNLLVKGRTTTEWLEKLKHLFDGNGWVKSVENDVLWFDASKAQSASFKTSP